MVAIQELDVSTELMVFGRMCRPFGQGARDWQSRFCEPCQIDAMQQEEVTP